ncbi:MAG: GNAT family N-acetyltransferase [Terriglobales bacterium]
MTDKPNAGSENFLDLWLENLLVWRESPALAMGGCGVRQPSFAAADLGRGWSLFNSVTLLQPLGSTVDSVLMEVADFYSPARLGDILLWSPWSTPDLRPFGWRPYDKPWLMRRAAHAGFTPPTIELRVEEVHGADQLAEFLDVVAAAFPFDDLRESPHSWDMRVLSDPRIRCWLGRIAGVAVATSAAVVAGGVNGVTLVSTLPVHRGKGIGALMADHAARAEPALPAGLLAGDKPCPVYERLGFERLQRFTVWIRSRKT